MRLNPQQNERFTNMVRQYPDFVQYLESLYKEQVDTMVNVDDSKLVLLQGKARGTAELIKILKSLA